MSEGTRGQQGNENYSLSEGSSTTLEDDRGPKGPLATLLNLDVLPSLAGGFLGPSDLGEAKRKAGPPSLGGG